MVLTGSRGLNLVRLYARQNALLAIHCSDLDSTILNLFIFPFQPQSQQGFCSQAFMLSLLETFHWWLQSSLFWLSSCTQIPNQRMISFQYPLNTALWFCWLTHLFPPSHCLVTWYNIWCFYLHFICLFLIKTLEGQSMVQWVEHLSLTADLSFIPNSSWFPEHCTVWPQTKQKQCKTSMLGSRHMSW